MNGRSITLKRDRKDGPSWTLSFEDGVVSLTGGAFDDAYAPVQTDLAGLSVLVHDLMQLASMATSAP